MCVNRIEQGVLYLDFKHLDEFCKAALKATPEAKFVFVYQDKGVVTFFAEDYAGSVFMVQNVEGNSTEFSAGFDFNIFLGVFKKLYEGEVKFTFKKSKVYVKLDNIDAQLPIASPKRRPSMPDVFSSVSDSRKDKIVSNLKKCLAIESPTKLPNKFNGVLMDNADSNLRICNFETSSIYLSSVERIFNGPYRIVVSDLFAKCVKSMDRLISAILFTANHIGLKYAHGTSSFSNLMADTYPKDYVTMWGIPEDYSKFANSEFAKCSFDKETLFNAVELISATLGDAETWINLEIVGEANDQLVWSLSGSTYSGFKIKEKILSTKGVDLEAFKLHKKSLLKCLGVYEDKVYMVDLNPSVTVFTDDFGRITLISKAKV